METVGMEKGANASSGFITSDNGPSSNSDARVVKTRVAEASCLSWRCMTGTHRENHLVRPFDRGGELCVPVGIGIPGGGGSLDVGPTGSDSGGTHDAMGNVLNRDDVSPCCAVGSQAFDIFATARSHSTPAYKSLGGMAASVGFPFTSAQWKELERQAMICRYMMHSVPVPPDLLFPLIKNLPSGGAVDSCASLYNVRCSKNGDLEPGRCRRTDGKKWRCSREVAPHQKYCERHLHRGRPRSRKHVEAKGSGGSHKRTRFVQNPVPLTASTAASQQSVAANDDKSLVVFNAETGFSVSAARACKGTSRDLGLMMEGGVAAMNGAEQRWQHLVEANMGFPNEGSSIYGCGYLLDQDYVVQQHQLNESTYSNLATPKTGFVDTWSLDNLNSSNNGNAESSLSTNHGCLSPSLNLSIAMAVGNVLDEEMGKVQMGGGVKCCDEDSRWPRPVSWEPFAQGGPLAEALQPVPPWPNPASSHDSISTPATTVSSPSGVLQRTLLSLSDSSVCNSPMFAAPPPEAAFQRLN